MNDIILYTIRTIKEHNLYNYLDDFPWLTGYIGNPTAPVWFVGENPSLKGVQDVHNRHTERTENLQWNSHDGDRLFRKALTESGFKTGDPFSNEGRDCLITNAVKEPEPVGIRNAKNSGYFKAQALVWLPVLQKQVDYGNPEVLVAIGNKALKLIRFMKENGLRTPAIDMIPHYSYIMFRPDSRTRLGPRHPARIREFKESIVRMREIYCG